MKQKDHNRVYRKNTPFVISGFFGYKNHPGLYYKH